jgi:hypothetical protein
MSMGGNGGCGIPLARRGLRGVGELSFKGETVTSHDPAIRSSQAIADKEPIKRKATGTSKIDHMLPRTSVC